MMGAMGFPAELTRRLTQVIAVEQAEHRVPSLSAAYVRDGAVAWADAVGFLDGRSSRQPATPDAQYRIGSITKVFVAVLVLRLVDDGRVDLTDRLDDHLRSTSIGQVTIEDLLAQRSGVRAETDEPWWERTAGRDWSELERQLALRTEARGMFHYSNVGFAVLAQLVSRLRGRPWDQVLTEEVLVPLGLVRTTVRPQPPHAVGLAVHPYADLLLAEPEHDAGAMAPAGQLWSTPTDLARVTAFLHRGDDRVLSEASRLAMRVPRSVADLPGRPWTSAYGLGLQVFNLDGIRQLGHGGSMPGFVATLRIDVANGDSVIVMANSTTGWTSDLTARMFELVGEHAPTVPTPWTADPDQASSAELTGTWFWGPSPLDLHAGADGAVELRPRGQGRSSRFRPTGVDTWVGLDGYYLGETLRAVRIDGRVSHWDLASFRLTRSPYDPDADVPGGVDRPWA